MGVPRRLPRPIPRGKLVIKRQGRLKGGGRGGSELLLDGLERLEDGCRMASPDCLGAWPQSGSEVG